MIKEATDDVEKSAGILIEYGFPPHNDINIKQFRLIANSYDENDKSLTDKTLGDFFLKLFNDERINGFLQKWLILDWLASRYNILEEAVTAHQQGMYYASISTLLPQIEGIFFERNGFIGKAAVEDLKHYAESLLSEREDFSLNSAVHAFYTGTVLANFRFGQDIQSRLSRHAILHGADTKFGYKLNSGLTYMMKLNVYKRAMIIYLLI